jgi:hypothetical protein
VSSGEDDMNSPCADRPENPSCIFKESTARAG